jgi:6,7-dimethyl-8-ribityllumazine synthase
VLRAIYLLRLVQREADFNALAQLLEAFGLERGREWKGRRNRGLTFPTPQAKIEVGLGGSFPDTDLVFEVASVDTAFELLRRRGIDASEPADTDWDSRMFTVTVGGHRIAVFSYNDPTRHEAATQGELRADGLRFGIVVSRFNSFITERLLAGALDVLRRAGAQEEQIRIVRVPGSFEIPSAARTLAKSGSVDVIICLGCLLRGETLHYEVIANEVTRGIGQSAQETGVPHAFGVLTCDTLEQAIDRAGLKGGNKGFEAAMSAIEMASLKKAVSRQPSAVRPVSKRGARRQNDRARSRKRDTGP